MAEAMDLARLPVIVTVRPKWEGGLSEKTEDQRLAMWEEAIEAGAEYIDVELVAWEKSRKIRETLEDVAAKSGTRIIVSNQCFDGRPGGLDERLERVGRGGAGRGVRVAWGARGV